MGRRHNRRVRDSRSATALTAGGAVTYIELTSSSQTSLSSFHLRYDATLVATFAYQTSNFEDVAVNSTTTGDWVTESSVTIAAAASSAAGQMLHVGNDGSLRHRLAVTTTTAGALDIATCEIEQ
jgi:hypothetical protein